MLVPEIPCPDCGYELKEALRRLKHDPRLICPGCGRIVQFKLKDRKNREVIEKTIGKLLDADKRSKKDPPTS